MFRVFRKIGETTWEKTVSIESLWAKWQLEALWNGEQVEYGKGVIFTMNVPDGHDIVEEVKSEEPKSESSPTTEEKKWVMQEQVTQEQTVDFLQKTVFGSLPKSLIRDTLSGSK